MSVDESQHERRRRYPLAKVKGGWTSAEDQILKRLVDEFGEGNWSVIARHLNAALGKPAESGRIGKQCRERYNHHLRPDIKKDAWTDEEESLLVEAHLRYGNRWSDIAKVIKGRTENAVKNHWNATLRRKDNDKCGGRGTPQSCVLRDYMIRISLLPGPAPGPPTSSGSRSAAACAPSVAPVPEVFRPGTAMGAGVETEGPLVPLIEGPDAFQNTQPSAKRRRAGSREHGDSEAAAAGTSAVGPQAAHVASGGSEDEPKCAGEFCKTTTLGQSPSSSCSSHDGLATARPRSSFEAPAVPSKPSNAVHASAPLAPAILPFPAAPQGVLPGGVRKRPRIITFAAVGPAAAFAATSGKSFGGLSAGIGHQCAPERGAGSSCYSGGSAAVVTTGKVVGEQRLQRHPSLPPAPRLAGSQEQEADTDQLVAEAASLRFHAAGRPRQHRRGERQPGWATDSAEESVHGSPLSERFERFEDDTEDATGCAEKQLGVDGPAACSEVQAAQIMLALKSLAGSLG